MIAFYSGAAMSPEAIRAADPDARFIARAHVTINRGEAPDHFAAVDGGEIWGIAVETSKPGQPAEVELTTDDGRVLHGQLAEPILDGDPTQVLANARYWELPPTYVAALRDIIEHGVDEE